MKFVLLFVGTPEDQDRWDSQSPDEHKAAMAAAGGWFHEYTHSGKIVGGEQLQGPKTVRTARRENGQPIVTDGPFIESKEIIGGFAIVDVKDRDEAEEMARKWPGGPVEIWPTVEN
jgi:hypothetical protein